jgi:hypothetical protein
MIRILLDANGLARSRFALSPVSETVNMLVAAGTGTLPPALRAPLRETLAARRLDLLSALVRVEPGQYVPDFIAPPPPRYESQAAEELHAVATTPTWRVAGELSLALLGRFANTVGRSLPRQLTEADEQQTAERLAKELEQVWLRVVEPRWPRITSRVTTRPRRRRGRARTTARRCSSTPWRAGHRAHRRTPDGPPSSSAGPAPGSWTPWRTRRRPARWRTDSG